MKTFCITGYPRSRTAWFSAFFTTGNVFCHHEVELNNPSTEYIGYSGSNFSMVPIECDKLVIIERDKEDVRKSLSKLTTIADQIIESVDLSKLIGLRIKFDEIDNRLEDIWNYCVDLPFPKERADLYKNLNIQQNYRYLL